MNNNIKVEQWLENEIRFVEVDGEWNAVAKDVTDALGFRMASDALRKTKDKYKGTAQIHTPGGKQTLITLTEDGLYHFLLNSRKTKAKELLSHLKEVDYLLLMQCKTPKQTQFEMLLREQIQRFYDTGNCVYTDWDYYVGYGVLLPEALDFKTEYKIPRTDYRVDFYIDGFDIIIEYDEKHHIHQLEEDARREAEITNAMIDNCNRFPTFIRVEEGKEYQGIIDLFALMSKRLAC